MNTKELMVGDLVKYGKKIRCCYNICGHTNDVLLDNGVLTNVSNIEPIPLQKNHLIKNGFVANVFDEVFTYNDGYEVRVIFDSDLEDMGKEHVIFLNINFPEKHLSMEIKYIHQLQQAMNIIGCEKKIIL